MSDTEAVQPQAGDDGAESARAERSGSIDLSNRPQAEWLDTVQSELNDTDLVLKCLARDSVTICKICEAASEAGELDSRPVLARCASTKQPR